jgi:ribosome biogenesis GTPase
MLGIVYKSTGSWYHVKSDTGEFYKCRIKGKFRIKDIKSTNPIAVGDKVVFELEKKKRCDNRGYKNHFRPS